MKKKHKKNFTSNLDLKQAPSALRKNIGILGYRGFYLKSGPDLTLCASFCSRLFNTALSKRARIKEKKRPGIEGGRN